MGRKEKKYIGEKAKIFGVDLIFIFSACAVSAFATVSVMIPNGLTSGGLTGILRIIQNYVHMDFSLMTYIGTFFILMLVWIFSGFREVRKVLLVSLVYPAFLFLFERLNLQLLEKKDVLLAAVFCGIFIGISCGMMFYRGYSFAGTDAISKIIRRKLFPEISQSKIMLMVDGLIIVVAAFIYGRNIALYALITQVILSKTIDAVMYGFESKIVQLVILTNRSEEISRYIIEDMNRGLSSHIVTGEYSKEEYVELRLLCSPRESIMARRNIGKIDPKAFVTVMQVDSVWGAGKGFQTIGKE